MSNISVARETIRITQNGYYEINGKRIVLSNSDHAAVEVYSPEKLEKLVKKEYSKGEMCRISVTAEDSFQAAAGYENAFVMNFANAHNAGGGFMLGANAQEESLCRCSTLYASINSKAAGEMYRYNNTHIRSVESDYMLYSPNVCVFRGDRCEFLENPFDCAVITVPAPNRHGAAIFVSADKIKETMTRRIRNLCAVAAEKGHRNLVLGAWGCGAFGNDPKNVSEYFRTVLIDEGRGCAFDEVCFAIYGSTDGKNYKAFSATFSK